MNCNDKLHHLLSQGMYEMGMDMADFDSQTRYARYTKFNVGDESTKYTVTISGFYRDVRKTGFLFFQMPLKTFVDHIFVFK